MTTHDPDRPDERTFIEPVDVTNDRLALLTGPQDAYVITDDGGNLYAIFLNYEDAVHAQTGRRATKAER